jgi:hypothetical protein
MEKHPELTRTSIREIGRLCGIPEKTLRVILIEAQEYPEGSLLFRVALCYGYNFKIYSYWNWTTNQNTLSNVISVVKWDWSEYKYKSGTLD